MKRRITIVAFVLVALAAIGCWLVIGPFLVIRKLDARYRQVQRGMSTDQVQAIMGAPGVWLTNPSFAGWDDTPLHTEEASRIRGVMRYTVSTFYLPVSFEFAFDEGGKVAGKHRYD